MLRLSRYRKKKGISQEELAVEAGMERSYVSDLERGARNPSVAVLARLAVALEVEPSISTRKYALVNVSTIS